MVTDPALATADPSKPPWLFRPEGAPVYYGFPIVEETRTEGWCYGAITSFLDPDRPEGCTFGDGFVVAPDGSRAGLVWDVEPHEARTILPPEEGRWGVYAIWFHRPVRSVEDLTFNFREVLPTLKRLHEEALRRGTAKKEPVRRERRRFWRR